MVTSLHFSYQEGEGKNLTNFECPGCAERKGVPYAYGKVDMEGLRERAGAAAPVAEVSPQAEEEPAGSEPASKTCTWPPPEAEYFFGERATSTRNQFAQCSADFELCSAVTDMRQLDSRPCTQTQQCGLVFGWIFTLNWTITCVTARTHHASTGRLC